MNKNWHHFGTERLTWTGLWRNNFVLLIISMLNYLGYEGVHDSTAAFAIKSLQNQSVWSSVSLSICFTASKQCQACLTSAIGNFNAAKCTKCSPLHNITSSWYLIFCRNFKLAKSFTTAAQSGGLSWLSHKSRLYLPIWMGTEDAVPQMSSGCSAWSVQDLRRMAPLVADASVSWR